MQMLELCFNIFKLEENTEIISVTIKDVFPSLQGAPGRQILICCNSKHESFYGEDEEVAHDGVTLAASSSQPYPFRGVPVDTCDTYKVV